MQVNTHHRQLTCKWIHTTDNLHASEYTPQTTYMQVNARHGITITCRIGKFLVQLWQHETEQYVTWMHPRLRRSNNHFSIPCDVYIWCIRNTSTCHAAAFRDMTNILAAKQIIQYLREAYILSSTSHNCEKQTRSYITKLQRRSYTDAKAIRVELLLRNASNSG